MRYMVFFKFIIFVHTSKTDYSIRLRSLNNCKMYNVYCTIGCSKMHLFPWNIPWPGAKESLSDVGFENIFFFKFCSSPERAIVENLFADFRKYYYTTFLMNLHIFFHILNKQKICACAQCIFWFLFLSIVRSISWRNRK